MSFTAGPYIAVFNCIVQNVHERGKMWMHLRVARSWTMLRTWTKQLDKTQKLFIISKWQWTKHSTSSSFIFSQCWCASVITVKMINEINLKRLLKLIMNIIHPWSFQLYNTQLTLKTIKTVKLKLSFLTGCVLTKWDQFFSIQTPRRIELISQ